MWWRSIASDDIGWIDARSFRNKCFRNPTYNGTLSYTRYAVTLTWVVHIVRMVENKVFNAATAYERISRRRTWLHLRPLFGAEWKRVGITKLRKKIVFQSHKSKKNIILRRIAFIENILRTPHYLSRLQRTSFTSFA